MKKLLLLIIVALALNNANAQWLTNGPAGKDMSCVMATDTVIYAGSYNSGVVYSINNGASWVGFSNGLTDTIVKSIAVTNSGLFAATADSGVYYSANRYSAWVKADSGLAYPNISSVTAIGSNIFAGSAGGGIFLSTDTGHLWTAVNNGLTNLNIYSLAVSDSNIFAGTYGGGVFLSIDSGKNWLPANTNITNNFILSLYVNGSSIFAGTQNGGFISNDAGSSWTPLNIHPNVKVYSFAVGGQKIVASTDSSIYLSTNGGVDWVNVGTGLPDSGGVSSLSVNSTTLFAGTLGNGIWQSALSQVTGLKEPGYSILRDFTVYPNPAADNFIVKTRSSEKELLQVLDITGKPVITQTIFSNSSTINTSNLSNGIYTIRLMSDKGIKNEKIVIVK